jgi:hypothetical protein
LHRPDGVVARQLQCEIPHDRGQFNRPFLQGQSRTNANSRAGPERKIGKSVDRLACAIEETVGIETVGLSPLRRLRKKEQRPSNTVGGGLVAGGDEGQNIRLDFNFGRRLAGFRIGCFEQKCQNGAWCAALVAHGHRGSEHCTSIEQVGLPLLQLREF